MKKIFLSILIVILMDLTFSRCANPSNPTGGPKDTIPPTLLNSTPILGTTNFNDQTFTLEFSEYINADKLNQNLIITPKTDLKFKHIIKRNELTIKFEEPFQDSTTYSFNFFTSVTDITEKNPAVNLVLAFSTGDYIDSMKVTGNVFDLMNQEKMTSNVVGLYPLTDTLDFLKENPMYFTTTNDSGEFKIDYIKKGLYKILAFNDDNGNLILDPETEAHGFVSDTVNLLGDTIPNYAIPTVLQNVKPITLINHRPLFAYHEIKFNKQIDQYTVLPDSLYHSIQGQEKDVIRIYNRNQFNYGDSVLISLTAYDSLDNAVSDTFNIYFQESSRTPPEFSINLNYSEKTLVSNPLYNIVFNKPIIQVDTQSIFYAVDSTYNYIPDSMSFSWNENKTELDLITYLQSDTLFDQYKKIIALDTASLDTAALDSIRRIRPKESPLEIIFDKGTFISVENDSSATTKYKHREKYSQAIGTLKLNLSTTHPSFTVQLLDSSGKVKYSAKNQLNPSFDVLPGTYSVRVLIDSNNDGTWSFGNLLRGQEPEDVFLFEEELPIRENWIVEDITISF